MPSGSAGSGGRRGDRALQCNCVPGSGSSSMRMWRWAGRRVRVRRARLSLSVLLLRGALPTSRKGEAVARGAALTIIYEPAAKRCLTATIPALPRTIRTGKTQHEARENVLGALAECPRSNPSRRRLGGQSGSASTSPAVGPSNATSAERASSARAPRRCHGRRHAHAHGWTRRCVRRPTKRVRVVRLASTVLGAW